MTKRRISAERVVITSFLVDLSDVVFNVIVAVLSGSVVMLSQALQGGADLLTSALLLVGLRQSRKRPSHLYRFGHGRELFFWVLMAGVSMFILTGTLSTYFGIQRFLHPEPIDNLLLSLGALAIGLVTNGYAFQLSFRRLQESEGAESFWQIVRHSSLIETKATLFLDLMGASASVLGLIALGLYQLTGNLQFDGVGAIMIGLTTAVLAVGLISSVKDLLVGKSANPELEAKIRAAALEIPGVEGVLEIYTMYLGSERLLANIDVHMASDLTTDELEDLIDQIKERVRERVPVVHHTQVELETPDGE